MFRASRRADLADNLQVEQFCITSGTRQQHPANMRVVLAASRRSSEQSRGDLYVVLENLRDKSVPANVYDQVIDTIADTYYPMSGSITRGLREALLAANSFLFERNLRADSEHHIVLGINCAVMRELDGEERDVYIAQMGPALITWVSDGGIERHPADSIWFHSETPGDLQLTREPPAGLRRDIEPNLSHVSLSSGDVLLISTTALARLATQEQLMEAVAHTGGRSARESLEALAQGHDLSVIVVETEGARQMSPEQEAPPEREPSAGRQVVDAAPPPAPSDEMGSRPVTIDRATPEESAQRRARPTEPGDVAPEPRTLGTERPGGIRRQREEPAEDWADSYEDLPGETLPPRVQPPRVDLDGLRNTLADGAERVRRGTEDVLLNVLPERLPERPQSARRPDSEDSISLSGRALVAVALVIPLIMLFIVVMTRIQYERTRHERFSSLQALAQARYDAAIKMPSEAQTRQGLYDTLATVEEGLAIDPGDEGLNELKRRIHHKMDEIDNVERLYHLWKLGTLDDEPISPTDSSRIVIQGIDVFVLNRGSSRVFKFLLNDVGDALQSADTNPILVQKGETRGGVKLGDIVDIAWMEAGGQRTLSTFVALERTGFLLAYDPQQGIDVLPVADSDIWLKPEAIGGYYGNLYVLDPLLGRILKYTPTDNAYTNPPSDYLSPALDVDLTGAVDLDIDGSVYVLFADGQISKFYQGEPQPFSVQGLPSPMRSPTTIFVSGPQEPDAHGYVYVTDTGNERILQFDKAGTYMRQFKAQPGESAMQRLRGIYVDEQTQRMFILSDKTLWLAKIPTLHD